MGCSRLTPPDVGMRVTSARRDVSVASAASLAAGARAMMSSTDCLSRSE